MNTEQIETALAHCKPLFLGVFSSDNLPHKPGLMVVNTDPAFMPGTHWIAIYNDGVRGEYFDSLGMEPTPTFRQYLNTHCKHWTFNDKQLQSVTSRFCGHYCVLFCLLRCRGENMRRIVSCFTRDTGLNDVLVHNFVCRNKIV
jgi:hypothetical protein